MAIEFFQKISTTQFRILSTLGMLAGLIGLSRNKELVGRLIGDFVKYCTDIAPPYQFECQTVDDSLFNQICYQYLSNLMPVCPDYIFSALSSRTQVALKTLCQKKPFDPHTAYGNLYKALFEELEDEMISLNSAHKGEDSAGLHLFINRLFANDNQCLELIFNAQNKAIEIAREDQRSNAVAFSETLMEANSLTEVQSNVYQFMQRNDVCAQNVYWPSYQDSYRAKGINVTASTYKPQYNTNIPSIRRYPHTASMPFLEYRFGTQAQRHNNLSRINPFFEVWCDNQSVESEDTIAHVYFNNLGLHRQSFEGNKEKAFSVTLQDIETRHNHIAMITLPADKGLMDRALLTSDDMHQTKETLILFQNVAMETDKTQPIRDFYISDRVRHLLYPNKDAEVAILKKLLNNSLEHLGLNAKDCLTSKEKHALYFDFIKFELTNYIINSLQPKSINFACKDAIDRAGASSAYFNLRKSIQLNMPMSQSEFEMALHTASAMVKGRAMNHHFNNIHNALCFYVEQNKDKITLNSESAWLMPWCNKYDSSKSTTLEKDAHSSYQP